MINILGWILSFPTLFLPLRPSRATNLHDTGISDGCIPIPTPSHTRTRIEPHAPLFFLVLFHFYAFGCPLDCIID